MSTTLSQTVTGVLNGSGNGSLQVGPSSSRQIWQVANVAVTSSSVTNIPQAQVTVGSTNIGGTYDGSNDSCPVGITLYPGEQITVTWTNGDANANIAFSVYGSIDIWGSA